MADVPRLDNEPHVRIVQDGNWWFGHCGVGGMDCTPPLMAWTRRGIERKAREWVARQEKRQEQQANSYTIRGGSNG